MKTMLGEVRASGGLLCALSLGMLVAACQSTGDDGSGSTSASPDTLGASGPESIIVAHVDQSPLSLREALDVFQGSHTGHGTLVRGESAVRELVGRLIERRMFMAEAATLGIPSDAGVLAAVDERRQKLAQSLFWKREVDEKVLVSDEDVRAFYDKTDVALNLSILETREEAEAQALRERVLAGEDFGELARSYSIHPTRTFDGVQPYVRRGELESSLEEPTFALQEPGQITPVVRTKSGWAFVRLDERTVNSMRPSAEVALPQIRSVLEGRAKDELRKAVGERLCAQAGVSVDEALLGKERLLAEGGDELPVARSAGSELSLGELRELLDLEVVRAAPEADVEKALKGIVDQWALEHATAAEVSRSGLLEDPAVAAGAKAFEQEQVLDVLLTQYVYAGIDPSEEELRSYYDAHTADEFTRPPEVRLAYIVVASEAEARAAYERQAQGESFEEIARQMSIDSTSAAHGGRIGWVRPGNLLEAVDEVVFATEPGTVAGPLETEQGWFVVKVYEKRPALPLPYEVSRAAALKRVYKEKQRAATATWSARLEERADVQIDEAGIQRAVAWLEAEALRQEAEAALAAPLSTRPEPTLLELSAPAEAAGSHSHGGKQEGAEHP